MSSTPGTRSRAKTVAIWAALGAACGIGLPTFLLGGELLRRLWSSWRGEGGESSSWGEPLFYMAILGLPLALIGLVLGGVAGAIRYATRTKSDPRAPS